jgi:hypothetical protein
MALKLAHRPVRMDRLSAVAFVDWMFYCELHPRHYGVGLSGQGQSSSLSTRRPISSQARYRGHDLRGGDFCQAHSTMRCAFFKIQKMATDGK